MNQHIPIPPIMSPMFTCNVQALNSKPPKDLFVPNGGFSQRFMSWLLSVSGGRSYTLKCNLFTFPACAFRSPSLFCFIVVLEAEFPLRLRLLCHTMSSDNLSFRAAEGRARGGGGLNSWPSAMLRCSISIHMAGRAS